jgi:hypothetical protein
MTGPGRSSLKSVHCSIAPQTPEPVRRIPEWEDVPDRPRKLIAKLEEIARGEDMAVERDRRARLADELEKTRRLAPGRKVRIDTAADVRDRVMQDLPAGIHLRPGELRIEFFGAEDLLRHLYELSQAMVNDFGRFQAAVEDSRLRQTAQEG